MVGARLVLVKYRWSKRGVPGVYALQFTQRENP